jgi:hypothetical protein
MSTTPEKYPYLPSDPPGIEGIWAREERILRGEAHTMDTQWQMFHKMGPEWELVERLRKERWPSRDASQFNDWEVTETEFLVEGLIPAKGLTWIGGLPKRGKSLFVLYVCLAIACGRSEICKKFKILGYPKILYIAREDPEARIKERIADICSAWDERDGTRAVPDPGMLTIVIRPKGFDMGTPEHLDWVRAQVEEHGYELVVLDTWTALSPGADPMEPKAQTVLAQAMAALTEDIDGAVLVVDHTRKNREVGQVLSSADIYGPSQKWQAAEQILMLAETQEVGKLEVFVEGKDAVTDRFFLQVSARGTGDEKFTYAGTVEAAIAGQKKKGQSNKELVFAIVDRAGKDGITRQAIADQCSTMGLATVKRHLTALIEAGRVVSDLGTYRSSGAPF